MDWNKQCPGLAYGAELESRSAAQESRTDPTTARRATAAEAVCAGGQVRGTLCVAVCAVSVAAWWGLRWSRGAAEGEALVGWPAMSLEVKDTSSRVKLKLRSTFLNKAADLFKNKGCSEEAAAEKARVTELQLYRASRDRAEYKDKAMKVFANLKKQDADADEDDGPAAKKQKLENDGGAEGADAADGDAGAESNPEANSVLVLTGDKTRDKVRARIATALKLVPERDRAAINKVRSSMQKAPLCEYAVAAAVEDEMHRVLTGAPEHASLLVTHAACLLQLTACGAQTRKLTRRKRGISLRTSTRQITQRFDFAC